jgi:nucleotide-binding universal stress UspA family protein
MFNRILVPLDGSKLAECVLHHVVAVASAFRASVTLFHVLNNSHRYERPVDPLQVQLRKLEAQAYLNAVQARLAEADLAAKAVIAEGSAAESIIEAARQQEIDLLILSTHGQGGLGEWNVSGVVEKVIQEVSTSLLLVRAYQEETETGALTAGYRRIMLPLDGSKRAECVLPPAEILARYWDAELFLAHVIRQPRLFSSTPPSSEDRALLGQIVSRHREEATRYFQRLRARLPIKTDFRLAIEENIGAALHEMIERETVDLILLSAHGHGCSRFQRYGSLVSCCILYGSAALLILPGLPPEQVEPTGSKGDRRAQEMEELRRPSGTGPVLF